MLDGYGAVNQKGAKTAVAKPMAVESYQRVNS